MLVFVQVSSMKTRRSGTIRASNRFHAARRRRLCAANRAGQRPRSIPTITMSIGPFLISLKPIAILTDPGERGGPSHNQIQVVVQTEVDSDGEALFDGFARVRCGRGITVCHGTVGRFLHRADQSFKKNVLQPVRARVSLHEMSVLIIAFNLTMSFRMIATMATLKGFPLARGFSWKARSDWCFALISLDLICLTPPGEVAACHSFLGGECGERSALVNDRFAAASGGGLKGRH
jgi:hypothetical protein